MKGRYKICVEIAALQNFNSEASQALKLHVTMSKGNEIHLEKIR